jgi:hypothetical protein
MQGFFSRWLDGASPKAPPAAHPQAPEPTAESAPQCPPSATQAGGEGAWPLAFKAPVALPAGYVPEAELDLPRLITLFKQACYDLEVSESDALIVAGQSATVWVKIDGKYILMYIGYTFRPESSRLERLEFVNRCNLNGTNQFSMGPDRLFAETRFSLVDGVSVRGLIQHFRAFEHMANQIVRCADVEAVLQWNA